MSTVRQFTAGFALFTLLSGCAPEPQFEATLYRTEGGVPHIVAPDYAGLGYGTAYAAAEDNVCLLAKRFLRLRGRLSETFGPDDGNVESDLFYQYMHDEGQYAQAVDPVFEELFAGYAAGYNRYLRDTGVDNLPDPSCRGATWVQEITADDQRNVHLTPFFLAGFLDMVLAADPPASEAEADSFDAASAMLTLPNTPAVDGKGSNGVAIGREGAASGNALLLANPHLDWSPEMRFYPMHQVIPGEINMLGANLFDRASVGVGTNGDIAWTNTVSTAKRFSLYQLRLQPGTATNYLFDGEPQEMEMRTVTVPVRNEDGSIGERSHNFYKTHFGYLVGGRFPWNEYVAFAVRIADESNRGVNGGLLAAYRAKSVRELEAVYQEYQFSPANLIAADKGGEVLYGDFGPVINMSDEQLVDCDAGRGMLDGARSDCQWQSSPGTAGPDILPRDVRPSIFRDDYVTNSNDSYWLANPAQPITGLPAVLGRIESERTVRTRAGLQHVQKRLAGTDGLEGEGFTLENLIPVFMSNHSRVGELLRDDLVALCRANAELPVGDGAKIEVGDACDALEGWDLHFNIESRGAHLFREFLVEAYAITGRSDWPRLLPPALNYREPFSLDAPLATPAGLDTDDNPNALLALGRAVAKLRDAGIALDAPLGELQGVTRNGDFIPLHGGTEIEGVFNKMEFRFSGEQGYPDVVGSSASWVMGVELSDDGPRAQGLISYSISANPESPHYADMTRRFSQKDFVDLPFAVDDVKVAATSEVTLSEPRPAASD